MNFCSSKEREEKMIQARYQYTYFIYPFQIKQNKVVKHIEKWNQNKKWRKKELPKENPFYYFFSTNDQEQQHSFHVWEYQLEQRVEGKTEEKGIFFQIQNIELICFQTGICFVSIKTCIENLEDFADVLNFNYKFNHTESCEKIRIQANRFQDIKTMKDLLQEITGEVCDNVNFQTFSYTCLDAENWNEQNAFEKIENLFYKYLYMKPYDEDVEFNKAEIYDFSNLKYAKYGITERNCVLLTSTVNSYNYTKLPDLYENQYLYTYLFALYQKYYAMKTIREVEQDINKANKMLQFYYQNWQEKLYDAKEEPFLRVVEEKLGVNEMIEKASVHCEQYENTFAKKIDKILLIILAISLGMNIINFIILIRNGMI